MANAPAWFVVPVQPGLLSQIAGYFKGSSGTYKVVKTFVSQPLYNQYTAAGYGPPYDTYAAAVTAAKEFAAKGKANALPGSGFSGIPPGSSAQQGPKLGNPLAGLAAIGDFFQRLSQANTWIRAGQVLAGLVLIAAGVARITHAIPAATKIATAVGTKGVL